MNSKTDKNAELDQFHERITAMVEQNPWLAEQDEQAFIEQCFSALVAEGFVPRARDQDRRVQGVVDEGNPVPGLGGSSGFGGRDRENRG
jgi:hypothetical protein